MNQTQGSKNQTWANVALHGSRPLNGPISQRTAVRVRLPDSQGKSPTELLSTVKPLITGAYAVRQLRSGDIEVAVPDQRTKDWVLNQPQVNELKIIRQDYHVELWGVPLSLQIDGGKYANNTALSYRAYAQPLRSLYPQLTSTRYAGYTHPSSMSLASKQASQGEQSLSVFLHRLCNTKPYRGALSLILSCMTPCKNHDACATSTYHALLETMSSCVIILHNRPIPVAYLYTSWTNLPKRC